MPLFARPSPNRGRRMAKGSHKTYGGWEVQPSVCWGCGASQVLSRGSTMYCFNDGRPFTLCGDCLRYAEARAALAA